MVLPPIACLSIVAAYKMDKELATSYAVELKTYYDPPTALSASLSLVNLISPVPLSFISAYLISPQ